jgi:hypothetical protein
MEDPAYHSAVTAVTAKLLQIQVLLTNQEEESSV